MLIVKHYLGKVIIISLCFWLVFTSENKAKAITVGEIIHGTEYLDCESQNPDTIFACQTVLPLIQDAMAVFDLSLEKGELVFSIDPVKRPGPLKTGHSCSHTAHLKSNYAKVSFASDTGISLDLQSISSPMVLSMRVPIELYARFNMKEKWGRRNIFGKCKKIMSDTYYIDTKDSMDMNLLIFVSLEPKMQKLENGDLAVIIEPLVKIKFQLDDVEFDFDMHNKNPLNGMMSAVNGGLSTILKRDGIKQLFLDVGLGMGQTLLSIDSAILDDFIVNLVSEIASDVISGIDSDIEFYMERKLKDLIAFTLQLDENGQRIFVLPTQSQTYDTKDSSEVDSTVSSNDQKESEMEDEENDNDKKHDNSVPSVGNNLIIDDPFDINFYRAVDKELKELYGDDYQAALNEMLTNTQELMRLRK
jgi:hypothetical protein